MFRYTYILLLLMLVISGCSETVSTGGPSEIKPLKEGNQWIYQYTIYDSLGTNRRSDIDTLYVGTPIAKGNENWYPMLSVSLRDPLDTTFDINRSDGMWETLYSTPHLKYKYPTAARDTFDVDLSDEWPEPGIKVKIFTETVSTSESVAVPAGIFKCIHYRRHEQLVDSATMAVKDDANIGDDYVSPGIGLIKSAFEETYLSAHPDSVKSKGSRWETVLLKYSLQ